jgi:TolB-like protein/tRNA A-37 threonylcarbamoyl transferase component Bud32
MRGISRRHLMNKVTAPSDSVAEAIEHPTECPQCGAITQLDHGTCINCLLREGLETKGEASREAFESVLIEANVTDKQWRLGHYEILEEIGRGGMGVIYRARQQHSRRIVAVKRILAHQVNSHETLVRFRREAEAVASLDHPNILPIHEVSESEEGLPFFSMKYARGGSLRTAAPMLRTKPRECVRLMAKVARAIAYAHGKGVLHRDLQPGNILLDENGEPMVSDFGLAKWLDQTSDLTRTLETLGTPGYIAPEQTECRADKLTCTADIYSLGAILFYLLTGRPPFVGANVLQVIHQAAAIPAPRLRSLVPLLDRDLETIVARCLEREPETRYRTADELAVDLEHWLEGLPITARRVSPPARAWRWCKRNPKLAAATGVAFCSAMAAIFLFFSHEGLSSLTAFAATAIALCCAIAVPFLFFSRKTSPSLAPPAKSIAVLPFETLGDAENVYLTLGMQDEIINNLARIADLKVISRTSVMEYRAGEKRNLRQIAEALRVTHVLEGSVQRFADRIRVHARLIDARTDTQVWAERYERDRADAFTIQTEIARTIAAQLQAKLSPSEKKAIERAPAKDLTAFDLYAQARSLTSTLLPGSTRANFLQAIDLLDEAVARDATFFQAYCQLVYVHGMLYFFNVDHTPARLAAAEAALESAFRLRPDAGEAHLARARHLYRGYLDYEDALVELERARQSLPNDPAVFELAGMIQRRQGRWAEALLDFQRAGDLDPRNLQKWQLLAITYHWLRQYDEASAALDRALSISPNDVNTQAFRALVPFHANAETQPLHDLIRSVRSSNPSALSDIADPYLLCALGERDPVAARGALLAAGEESFGWDSVSYNHPLIEGVIARMTNHEDEAQIAFAAARTEQEDTIRKRPNYGPAICMLGLIDAGLGRKEEALHEGRRATELMPVEKDAMNGTHMIEHFAMIAAWAGEHELAFEQLAIVLNGPSRLSYGALKLLPFWDPLRGDPRFEKLVEESKKPVVVE